MLAHTHTHKRLCPMAACDAIAMQIAPCNFAHKLSRCDASFVSRARHWERRKEPLDFHSSLTLAGSTRLCPFCAALSAAPRTICMLNGVYLMPRHFGASTLRLSRSPARECDCVFFFFFDTLMRICKLKNLDCHSVYSQPTKSKRARPSGSARESSLHTEQPFCIPSFSYARVVVWFWLMRLFRIVCEIYRYLICCAAAAAATANEREKCIKCLSRGFVCVLHKCNTFNKRVGTQRTHTLGHTCKCVRIKCMCVNTTGTSLTQRRTAFINP